MKLKLETQSAVQYGSKGTLGDVTVHAVDVSGNVSAPQKDYEVTLRPAAMSPTDSSLSAKVAAHGTNRARMVDGQAVFKDVQLTSDAQGLFELAAYCRSRAVVSSWPALHRLSLSDLQLLSLPALQRFRHSW